MAMMKSAPEMVSLMDSLAHLKEKGGSAIDLESCCAIMKECC